MKSNNFSQFIITRKRKKYKFAHFDSFANCFSHAKGADPTTTRKHVFTYLDKTKPLILEIAAGNAQFSLVLAKKYPSKNFIAIDIKSDRLYTSAKRALEEDVQNIIFLRTHMYEVDQIFKKDTIDEIWLTFPDPFPRARSAKHRLTHPSFLKRYATILKKQGSLKFKTDNHNLFLWSLEQFVTQKWQCNELSFDLHESNLPADYKIKTHYEERFTKEGIPINFCTILSLTKK